MKFFLKCWIPSKKDYTLLSELSVGQLTILSKYLLNEDHEGASQAFDEIIFNNLENKNLFNGLTKFDKWFVLTFLRAANISSTVYIQTATKNKVPCNVEIDLFELLTNLSEIFIPELQNMQIDGVEFKFNNLKKIFSKDIILDVSDAIVFNNELIKISTNEQYEKLIKENKNIFSRIQLHIGEVDRALSMYFLIKPSNETIEMNSVPLKLYDNTLFHFLRSIYLPFCKSLFNRKYKLLKHIGLDYSSIESLTLAECEVYLSQHIAEENDKKSKQNTSTR